MSTSQLSAAKRRSSQPTSRGRLYRPHSVDAAERIGQRVLAVKLEIDWKRQTDKDLYNRLRDLGWQAARYRNGNIRRLWAEAMGWRVDPDHADKHDVTKQGRQTEKAELSGAAYSAAEREVSGAWSRDCKKILAGQPLSEWSPGAALSVRGHKNKEESGVRLELEAEQYVAYLSAQSAKCPGGCWLRLPIAKNTRRDEWQAPILNRMVSWETPIAKAQVQIKKHTIILRLTYAVVLPPLPTMGKRIAILGPTRIDEQELLHLDLRTEQQRKDYSSKINYMSRLKDEWDKIRRRAKMQIGWRHGQARLKREAIARFSLPDKEASCLHAWTREIVDWCASQGVGTIRVVEIATGDWPADRFTFMLNYKAEEKGIRVEEGSDLKPEASARAARAALGKRQRQAKKRAEAVRTLRHHLGGSAAEENT